MKVFSKQEFDAMSPYQKGYIVYMCGSRDDQPNIPEHYEPTEAEKKEFERGQLKAVLDVQDGEE